MRRKWITFMRVLRYGVNNFSRNAWLTTAATIVMVITLTIILTTLIARMVFADTLDIIRQKIDISVFLRDDITKSQQSELVNAIKAVPIVTDIDYISKDQARQKFVEDNKGDTQQLQAIGELGSDNPFPASLRVHVKDTNKLEQVYDVVNQEKFKKMQSAPAFGSDERKQAVERIASVAQFSEIAGLAGSTLFLMISIMIIFNTIRMAIFNRRDEIEIMKLIGAEKSFIRGPFIMEACLYGVIAALASVALVYLALVALAPGMASYGIEMGPTIKFFTQWPIIIMGGQILVGIFIGIISSLLAMRRYLKV